MPGEDGLPRPNGGGKWCSALAARLARAMPRMLPHGCGDEGNMYGQWVALGTGLWTVQAVHSPTECLCREHRNMGRRGQPTGVVAARVNTTTALWSGFHFFFLDSLFSFTVMVGVRLSRCHGGSMGRPSKDSIFPTLPSDFLFSTFYIL